MVIQGRSRTRKTKPKEPTRPSPTSLIARIASLQRKPDKEKALDILHKVAVNVAPIMQENNLNVGLLAEFFPKDKCLLGLNVNRGQKVLVRLRSPFNEHQFLPFTDILGTTLHELVHNHLGPHNKAFYDKLEAYKERYFQLSMKSAYQQNGFAYMSSMLDGTAIGSGADGERTATTLYKGETRKLGSLDSGERKLGTIENGKRRPKKSLKELIRDAAEQRAKDMNWCAEEQASTKDLEPGDDELEIEMIKEIIYDDEDNGEGTIVKSEPGVADVSIKVEPNGSGNSTKDATPLKDVDPILEAAISRKRKHGTVPKSEQADVQLEVIELDPFEGIETKRMKKGKEKVLVLGKPKKPQGGGQQNMEVIDLT